MKDRIKSLVDLEQLSSSQFAAKIGISPSSLHHIVSGRNNPSLDIIQKILNAMPHISAEWLISGKGNMTKQLIQGQLFTDEELGVDSTALKLKREAEMAENSLAQVSENGVKTHKQDHLSNTPQKQASNLEHKGISENLLSNLGSAISEQNNAPTKKIRHIILTYEDGSFEFFDKPI